MRIPLVLTFALALGGSSAIAQEPPKPAKEAPPDETQRKYATLVVEVKDEEGKGLESAVVSLDHAGGTTERAGTTGESGFIQLLFVKAGSYFVRVRLKGYAPEEQAVRLDADKRATLTFVMKRAKA